LVDCGESSTHERLHDASKPMCKGQALTFYSDAFPLGLVDGTPRNPVAFGMSDCSGTPSPPGCALTLLLLDAARAVEARAEGALAEVGLSLAKLGALRHLVLTAEPLTLSHLAERHCCGKSNVTQLVDRLEADGFVARVADLDDRRTIRAAVTESGRAAYERANVLLAELERALDTRLGAAPRAELARQLRTLREE